MLWRLQVSTTARQGSPVPLEAILFALWGLFFVTLWLRYPANQSWRSRPWTAFTICIGLISLLAQQPLSPTPSSVVRVIVGLGCLYFLAVKPPSSLHCLGLLKALSAVLVFLSIAGYIYLAVDSASGASLTYQHRSPPLAFILPGRWAGLFFDFQGVGICSVYMLAYGLFTPGRLRYWCLITGSTNLILAESRAALLAATVVILLWLLPRFHFNLSKRSVLSATGPTVLAILFAAVIVSASGKGSATNGRDQIWADAAAVSVSTLMAEDSQFDYSNTRAHNLFLALSAYYGLLALALFLITISIAIFVAWKNWKTGRTFELAFLLGLLVLGIFEDVLVWNVWSPGLVLYIAVTLSACSVTTTQRRCLISSNTSGT